MGSYLARFSVQIGLLVSVLAWAGVFAGVATAESIAGQIIDQAGQPVPGVVVILCDEQTGIPVASSSMKPFTNSSREELWNICFRTTDAQGRFNFENVPAGSYRLVGQTWPEKPQIERLLDVHGEMVRLHGVAQVSVPDDQAKDVRLTPLGNASLVIDQKFGNDETLLVVSTSAFGADPILGFAGWVGSFQQHMIAANRMPNGRTTLLGLPEGEVHLAIFAADNNPGFGAGSVKVFSDRTVQLTLPIVASWSNGHHTPPVHLLPVVQKLKEMDKEAREQLPREQLPEFKKVTEAKERDYKAVIDVMARLREAPVTLSDGQTVTLKDYLAASAYISLEQTMAARGKRPQPMPPPANVSKDSYAHSLYELHRELGAHYPCFELKGIDWAKVGRELLPLANTVQTQDEFGLLCMRLVARLKDSHAQLLAGTAALPTVPLPQWEPGFACLKDDRGNAVVYHVVSDSPADAAGVRVGMTVESVNGVPARKRIEQTKKHFTDYFGYSSDRLLEHDAYRLFLREPVVGTMVTIALRDWDGTKLQVDLPCSQTIRYLPRLPVPKEGIDDSGNVSWKMLDGKVGYIYVRRIRPDLPEQLDLAVRSLKDAVALIIDVRGNSGGGFDVNRAFANFTVNKLSDQPADDRPRFIGPMAVLLDARCISAGEGWVSWFVSNDRATTFGETTAGASARKTTYTLANGLYKVIYPVKAYTGFLDRPIERLGIVPDVPVTQTAEDLHRGRDTVLETARAHLLKNLP